jgi:hypothetical protein
MEESGATVFPDTGAAYVSTNQLLFEAIGRGSIVLTAKELGTLEGLRYTSLNSSVLARKEGSRQFIHGESSYER